MDRRTLLAIVISIGIFIAWYIIQSTFFPQTQTQTQTTPQSEDTIKKDITDDDDMTADSRSFNISTVNEGNEEEPIDQIIIKQEEFYTIEFSTKGGLIKSLKLNEYKDIDKTLIDMVKSEESGMYPFIIYFGEYSTANDIFTFKSNEADHEYQFIRHYKVMDNTNKEIPFTLIKTFTFTDDYIIDFEITLESDNREYLPLNYDDVMYTFTYGPQIGPEIENIDSRDIFPKYIYFNNKDRKDVSGKLKNNTVYALEKDAGWMAIEGKYFAVIIDPPSDFTQKYIGFDTRKIEGLSSTSSMFFKRPYEKRVTISEKFKIYAGPKIKKILEKYENYDFQKIISGFPIIDQLVDLLQIMLSFINNIVKNWGVAIIIMTIIIKVIFFPLTQKGFQSTAKMQALNPKIEEIKAKYKDNPQKTQVEIGNLYKEHKINPLAGCLPWLIQIPIFISLFSLLRNQFDLRGAVFISGWINDLSAPENLWQFPWGEIPLVKWTHLNILPIFMTGMMIVQQKFTQTPNSAGTSQMKMLMYAMPAFFFFICYNMPSGVVLYWTVQNIISLFQQILINNVQKKEKGAATPPAMQGKFPKKKR